MITKRHSTPKFNLPILHLNTPVDSVTTLGQILFHSLLRVSFRGCCYITTPQGDIMIVDLSPITDKSPPWKPRMVYLLREAALGDKVDAFSYLVRSQDRMLMVRYSFSHHSDLVNGDCDPTKVFVSRGVPSRIDAFEVDLGARRLIPLSSIGDYTVFLGEGHTVMLSSNNFPKIIADAVYMSYIVQRLRRFGAYRFKDGTTMPPADLRHARDGRDNKFLPCACHLELDDYLICSVQLHDNFHSIISFVD